ncbi:integrase [Steroidobacter agaridevorans]|uniref:Integrase n=1 Tax=Steroidobacter agaridevorans TaxID=2695856 RepID=A0A829Y7H2_9GAMM|nr:integrase [Steroidobacter agaridevorans]
MTESSPDHPVPASRLFVPLERAAFTRLEHAASLKGLLRPFKGKGEMEIWASDCELLRDQLISLAQQLLAQATAYPFSLLPVVLAQQTTGAGTTLLRWRSADRTAMGVSLWTQLIESSRTPLSLVHELFALEQQRVVLNMQISLTHALARNARECSAKLTHAETTYRRRADRHDDSSPKESSP